MASLNLWSLILALSFMFVKYNVIRLIQIIGKGIVNEQQQIQNHNMEQLQSIFWERNKDITSLKQKDQQNRKAQFLDRQRNRIQRQNWIFKIIKTIRQLTGENKKVIFQSILRMMTYFSSQVTSPPAENEIDFDKKFTQNFINLFFTFFNTTQFGDISSLKRIIRPSNSFIVIDLIKLFVDCHRHYFKVKMMEIYKQPNKIRQFRRNHKSLQLKKQIPVTQEESQVEQEPKKQKKELTTQDKIKYTLYDKYKRFVNYFNEHQLIQRVNEEYIDLLYRNQNNAHYIRKFQEKCHGKIRIFNYNISGLYSKLQMKTMHEKMQNEWKNKYSQVTQLRGQCNNEQLKEYFKMKAEVQQNLDNIYCRQINKAKVIQWLPLIIQKTNKQGNPLTIQVDLGKEIISYDEIWQKYGINLRNYLRKILNDMRPQRNIMNQESEMKYFRKNMYLDINKTKIKELLTDQHRVYLKEKRQSIFPILRANELKQQTEPQVKETIQKHRSTSEYKLMPIFKNEVLNKKLEEKNELIYMKSEQEIKEPKTQRENVKSGRSRIDNIIASILNERNLTVHI